MKRHQQAGWWILGGKRVGFILLVVLASLCLSQLSSIGRTSGSRVMAQDQVDDNVARSAIYLLKKSLEVDRSGRHNRMLSAIRHLRDPMLEPLFAQLAEASHPVLQIHGLLGLAEVSTMQKLDMVRVAMINDPAVQAQLVTAAMDSDLLNNDDAGQLLDWPDLDIGVKVLVATRLVEAGRFTDLSLLHQVLEDEKLGRQGLAALLLHQLGDTAGLKKLRAIDVSSDATRDEVRQMIIEAALRHGFDNIGLWACNISKTPGVDEQLGLLAMRAAMRFGQKQAYQLWQQQYHSAGDITQQTRLAIIALQLSPYLDAQLFDELLDSNDQLVRQIGRAGRAIANDSDDIADQIDSLIAMHHPLMNSWSLSYCRDHAGAGQAKLIYLTLILAYEKGPESGRIKRLDIAVDAAQELYELDPEHAAGLLSTILADKRTKPDLRKGILLALLRTHAAGAETVVDQLLPFEDSASNNLALLLLAKHENVKLTKNQFKDLQIIVQGGGGLQDTLRVQAAWAYLKRTGQAHLAIVRMLDDFE